MMRLCFALAATLFLTVAQPFPADAQSSAQAPIAVPVVVDPALGPRASGRLLLFVAPADGEAAKGDAIDTSPFNPAAVTVIAREVDNAASGDPIMLGGASDAFPAPLDALPPGNYRLQAVLDRDHNYNYGGRAPGDFLSDIVDIALPGPVPTIHLTREIPAIDPDAGEAKLSKADRRALAAAKRMIEPIDVPSARLSEFWGRPIAIRGWIALPPGYGGGKQTYPTVYSDGGFGSSLASTRASAIRMAKMMAGGELPPMIWVFLDHHLASGTHEFADSANNGPWGSALIEEAIPALESRYRMDARSSGRFLTGHSSGGWSTLWLQVTYPSVFGGSWPTSPDPSDFHDFTNVNLYAGGANAYRDADGKPHPVVRDHDKLIATLEQFARLEAVLGAYGGQFASFDWVFSPRCPDGRPCPMFDRATGDVDPAVVAYWRDHYDIAHIVARDWAKLKPDLDGKVHLTVGTADTFYLDGAAHRLEAVMRQLGAKTDFRFLPGKTHFDLFERDGDNYALMKDITREMMAVARPQIKPAP